MKTERRLLSDLKPAEYNPRVRLMPEDDEYQKIKESIERFTYVDPIIVNTDGTIIGGHQRYNILLDLGYEAADVSVVDLDKDDEKALNITLNKLTGQWDEIKLRDLLEGLKLDGYDFTITGFTQNDLDDLNVSLQIEEAAEDEDFDLDKAIEEAKEPITKRGDIWILGRHRLMCGDSTSADDMARLLQGEQVDLVITDPPYNVAYGDKVEALNEYLGLDGERLDSQIANDNMDEESFHSFLVDFYEVAEEAMRPGAVIYVFHADSNGYVFRDAWREAGLKLAQCLIWEKNSFVLGRQDYQWRHEPILYGWKEGAGHYFIDDRSQDTVILEDELDFDSMKKSDLIAYLEEIRRWMADRTTVLYENKPTRNTVHPTMKPVTLVGRLMKNSSKPGWTVLDSFGGSGTTIMAAEQLNRTAYLMELDERFCDVIVKRWEDYTGQKAHLENKNALKEITLS